MEITQKERSENIYGVCERKKINGKKYQSSNYAKGKRQRQKRFWQVVKGNRHMKIKIEWQGASQTLSGFIGLYKICANFGFHKFIQKLHEFYVMVNMNDIYTYSIF